MLVAGGTNEGSRLASPGPSALLEVHAQRSRSHSWLVFFSESCLGNVSPSLSAEVHSCVALLLEQWWDFGGANTL